MIWVLEHSYEGLLWDCMGMEDHCRCMDMDWFIVVVAFDVIREVLGLNTQTRNPCRLGHGSSQIL